MDDNKISIKLLSPSTHIWVMIKKILSSILQIFVKILSPITQNTGVVKDLVSSTSHKLIFSESVVTKFEFQPQNKQNI